MKYHYFYKINDSNPVKIEALEDKKEIFINLTINTHNIFQSGTDKVKLSFDRNDNMMRDEVTITFNKNKPIIYDSIPYRVGLEFEIPKLVILINENKSFNFEDDNGNSFKIYQEKI